MKREIGTPHRFASDESVLNSALLNRKRHTMPFLFVFGIGGLPCFIMVNVLHKRNSVKEKLFAPVTSQPFDNIRPTKTQILSDFQDREGSAAESSPSARRFINPREFHL
jgi:hypothetical protein